MNALQVIQEKLKAPKGQFNSFGKYRYRSLEDILEALKPLLKEVDASLMLSDEVVNIGVSNYVKAKAMLVCGETTWQTHAFARESVTKKGMDDSQITGTASSYARKYALNGLFCIDDTKDADTMDNSVETKQRALTEEEKSAIAGCSTKDAVNGIFRELREKGLNPMLYPEMTAKIKEMKDAK